MDSLATCENLGLEDCFFAGGFTEGNTSFKPRSFWRLMHAKEIKAASILCLIVSKNFDNWQEFSFDITSVLERSDFICDLIWTAMSKESVLRLIQICLF
jgi:hypothetical protein